MLTITGKNVNEVFPVALMHLAQGGVTQASRGGATVEYPEPVSVCYTCPQERVLFDASRDANPFFHLAESLWIIGGRDDVSFLTKFNSKMGEYSDDGKVFHGAYGARIKEQLPLVIDILRRDPDSRRAVLQIWDWPRDLGVATNDAPCNTLLFLKIRQGALNIHVANRSNDLLWGMMGANVVQFSMLQEYIAEKLGVTVGTYHQTTDSMHAYTDNPQWDKLKGLPLTVDDPYNRVEQAGIPGQISLFPRAVPFALGAGGGEFDADNQRFLDDPFGDSRYTTPFFEQVVAPMMVAWVAHKSGATTLGITALEFMAECDWRLAAQQWLLRRRK